MKAQEHGKDVRKAGAKATKPKVTPKMAAKTTAETAPKAMKAKRRAPRSDDGNAFIPDPEGGPARTRDDLAENLAEGFLQGATQDDEADEAALEGWVPEEIGGPFVESDAAAEFADGTDGSNPADAEREPMPRPMARLIHGPEFEQAAEQDAEEEETD
jgi:hypothetical protein